MRHKKLVLGVAALGVAGAGYAAGRATAPATKGYVVAEIEVTDPATYEIYKPKAAALIAKYGGRYLVRGGRTVGIEGEPPIGRFVVLEFASVAKALAFEQSAEYRQAAQIRQRAAKSRVFVAEGAIR